MGNVIASSEVLKEFLNSVIREKTNKLIEKNDSNSLEQILSKDAPSEDKETNSVSETPEQDISAATVVDKLNSIRAGKSFKDSLIDQRLNSYFDSLSKDEQAALVQFLSGLAQVVTGEVPEKIVKKTGDPSNPPANVEIKSKKNNEKASLKVKPNIVVNKPADTKKLEPGKEDTSSPAQVSPIAPKKR